MINCVGKRKLLCLRSFTIEQHCFMRLLPITSILLLIIMFSPNNVPAQGLVDGFYNDAKNFTAVIGAGYEDNPTYLAGDNELGLEKSFFNVNAFLGYGIATNLDINLAVAYVKSDQEQDLQDARIAIKYKFYQTNFGEFNVSTQLAGGISFPLTNYETEDLNAIGQRATSIPSRLLVHAQHNNGFFVTAQSGYDYKFDSVPNAVGATLKLGLAKKQYYLDTFLDVQNSVNGRDYRGFPAPDNFRELEVDFVRLGATFFKSISENFGVFVNGAYTVNGRNVGLGPAINLGLTFKSRL